MGSHLFCVAVRLLDRSFVIAREGLSYGAAAAVAEAYNSVEASTDSGRVAVVGRVFEVTQGVTQSQKKPLFVMDRRFSKLL